MNYMMTKASSAMSALLGIWIYMVSGCTSDALEPNQEDVQESASKGSDINEPGSALNEPQSLAACQFWMYDQLCTKQCQISGPDPNCGSSNPFRVYCAMRTKRVYASGVYVTSTGPNNYYCVGKEPAGCPLSTCGS